MTVTLYVLYLNIWNITSAVFSYSNWFIFLFAFLSLAIPFTLVKLFAKTKSTGSGTHYVLETYHLRNGETSLRDTLIKPLASIITLGFGGSAGPEGPSLLVGGGIAANISKRLNIKVHHLRRIFVAGAAAGLTAVFRTPLTGILFALNSLQERFRHGDIHEAHYSHYTSIPSSVLILGSEQISAAPGGQIAHRNWASLLGLHAVFAIFLPNSSTQLESGRNPQQNWALRC